MNVWSLGRFPSINGCNVSSCLNNIGYFAYSINLKIIIIDLNSMIDGNNGNLLLRSSTFNRTVVDFQELDTSIKIWKDYRPKTILKYSQTIYEKVNIKSLFVNEISWGPFINYRWSMLFTSLNNGLINVWLIPIIDSFSLSSYSPIPSFELLDLLHNEMDNIVEFDLNEMRKVSRTILDSFCSELLLNKDNPKIQSCSFSIQNVCLCLNNNYYFYFVCFWNKFIVIYNFKIYDNDKKSIESIIDPKHRNLVNKFPYIPSFECKPLYITKLPEISKSEIITCCSITETWKSFNNLFFEILIGTSNGRILLTQFKLEDNLLFDCVHCIELKKITPTIPISTLNYEKINDKNDNSNKYIWSASYSANIIFGVIDLTNNFTNLDLTNNSNTSCHKLPIKAVKTMNHILIDGKLHNISFFSFDQSGVGIIYCFDLNNNTFTSLQTLSMNKLSSSQTVFPNLDQNTQNTSNNSQQSINFESLQNVPLSIQNYKNNIEDYILVSFVNSTIPGHFNFIKNDFQTYSVALIYSAKLNTIRIMLVFNPSSLIDHISIRINTHFSQVDALINSAAKHNENEDLLFKNLFGIISSIFTLNDIRLVLGGPLSMRKIPILDDYSVENNVEISESNHSNTEQNEFDLPYSSFLNFNFGKLLKSKTLNLKDKNDDLMSYITCTFYNGIPDDIINSALLYSNIKNEFSDEFSEFLNNSKPVFSNLLLLFICYISELDLFIPKYMDYVTDLKENSIGFMLNTLIAFYNSSISLIGNTYCSNIDQIKQRLIVIYLCKLIYLTRMINSVRCFIVLLYSRSNDQIDSSTLLREEKMSFYLKKLQYYAYFRLYSLYKDNIAVDQNNSRYYIWNCINNNTKIQLENINFEYLDMIKKSDCKLISDNEYNSYICSLQETQSHTCNCIFSLPVCPITFLPITSFSSFKHLSCSSCGKITFIHQNLIDNDNVGDTSPSFNSFEKYVFKNGYISCQICLNFVEFLEL